MSTRPTGCFGMIGRTFAELRQTGLIWLTLRLAACALVLAPLAAVLAASLLVCTALGMLALLTQEMPTQMGQVSGVPATPLLAALLLPVFVWLAQLSLCAQALVYHEPSKDSTTTQADPVSATLRLALNSWPAALGLVLPYWVVVVAALAWGTEGAELVPSRFVGAALIGIVLLEWWRVRRIFWAMPRLGVDAAPTQRNGRRRLPRFTWRSAWRLRCAEGVGLLAFAVLLGGGILALTAVLPSSSPVMAVAASLLVILFASIYTAWHGLLAVVAFRDPHVNQQQLPPFASAHDNDNAAAKEPVAQPEAEASGAASDEPFLAWQQHRKALRDTASQLGSARWRWAKQAVLLGISALLLALLFDAHVLADARFSTAQREQALEALPYDPQAPRSEAERRFEQFIEQLKAALDEFDEIGGLSMLTSPGVAEPAFFDDAAIEAFFARHPKLLEAWEEIAALPLSAIERTSASVIDVNSSPGLALHRFLGMRHWLMRNDPEKLIRLLEEVARLLLVSLRHGVYWDLVVVSGFTAPMIQRLHEDLLNRFGATLERSELERLDRLYRDLLGELPPIEQLGATETALLTLEQPEFTYEFNGLLDQALQQLIWRRGATRAQRLIPRFLEEGALDNREFAKRQLEAPRRYVDQLGEPGLFDVEFSTIEEGVFGNIHTLVQNGRTLRTILRLCRLTLWVEAQHNATGEFFTAPEQWRRWHEAPPLNTAVPSWRDDWSFKDAPFELERFAPLLTWRGDGRFGATVDRDAVEQLGTQTLTVAWEDSPLDEVISELEQALDVVIERDFALHEAQRETPERYRVTLSLEGASAVEVFDRIGQQLALITTDGPTLGLQQGSDDLYTPGANPFAGGYYARSAASFWEKQAIDDRSDTTKPRRPQLTIQRTKAQRSE